ncbi:hypothetical protein CTRG_03838 [Candida tropicalis MYA-3404]|uniref:Uncharacterized protein n=1 Tax=Candida tropicalis (strain ATCC MYA-3404 / T1) TaxID=294747 RepID=C5MDT6_CANTT|nr:hypothetical protein CTRG_03838 [Candida tropicalis MYA-3404]EER32167.1 hypothetical protein CTRG_03838 [Candida tropicalis MYA-3404]KAG4405766.1 hypothetical protein JTP64_004637 [Candida tropicalis]
MHKDEKDNLYFFSAIVIFFISRGSFFGVVVTIIFQPTIRTPFFFNHLVDSISHKSFDLPASLYTLYFIHNETYPVIKLKKKEKDYIKKTGSIVGFVRLAVSPDSLSSLLPYIFLPVSRNYFFLCQSYA